MATVRFPSAAMATARFPSAAMATACFPSVAMATTRFPSAAIVTAAGFRCYSTKDDLYEKAKIKSLYCNHPNCQKWVKSDALSDPEHMKHHWDVVHDYKGTKSCTICGNCIEDKLRCASFCPNLCCPRTGKKNTVEVEENVGGRGGKRGSGGKRGKGGSNGGKGGKGDGKYPLTGAALRDHFIHSWRIRTKTKRTVEA